MVRKISVVPRPYQDPHPPLFQPFSVSENTIRYTAQSGIVPWILVSYPPDFQRLCRLYREVAAELALQHAINAAGLLFFAKLQAVIRYLAAAALRVLAGRQGAPFESALGEALLALQEELYALTTAKLANRSCVSCHLSSNSGKF